MATDKTQGLPHVAAATAAEIAAAAIAPFVQKRLASLLRSRDACEAELKIVSGVPEYLGGSSVPVNIAPVAQTSASAISGSATPRVIFLRLVLCFLSLVSHNHLRSMALS